MGRRRKLLFNLASRRGRQRFYQSALWREFRRQKMLAEPWCRRCRREGRVRPAEELHHRQPLAERPDLAMDSYNCEPLCKSHHSAETARKKEKKR